MPSKFLIPSVAFASLALLAFAHWFDFQCDDAFIAFRYAKNWVEHGQVVYNLGERVEGYTSFGWVALLAGLHGLGLQLPQAAKLLGAVSGILLMVFTAQFGRTLFPKQWLPIAVLLALVAGNVSVAAWTLGGLETPLFAALTVGSLCLYRQWLERGTSRDAFAAAMVFGAATLTRPEAGLLLVAGVLALLPSVRRNRRFPRGAIAFATGYSVLIGCHLLWRHSYYGDWLPNTFYVKTTGLAGELRERGVSYLGFAAEESGLVFVAAILGLSMSSAFPARHRPSSLQAMIHSAQLFVIAMLGYLVSIGGDFLDLYRFLVPLFPLLFGLALYGLSEFGLNLAPWLHRRVTSRRVTWPRPLNRRWLAPLVATGLVTWYLPHQMQLARRAMQIDEPGRIERQIEPLGWTASYVRRWAAMGRWLAAHSRTRDVLAVGAAGAMPFYSGLPNIDIFGLCDRHVAHHGNVIGSRPGHQRLAPVEYLLRQRPTFLLIGDYTSDKSRAFRRLPTWASPRYTWVEAHLTPSAHRAPTEIYHYFLTERVRAEGLRGTPDVRVSEY